MHIRSTNDPRGRRTTADTATDRQTAAQRTAAPPRDAGALAAAVILAALIAAMPSAARADVPSSGAEELADMSSGVPGATADVASDASASEAADSVWLRQIVVTGTRTPRALGDAPIVTHIITREDIARTDATTVADVMQSELPGVEFSFAMNQQTSLNMQGFGGNSVLFLVDGERLAGETIDNVDYARLTLDDVGHIEIVRGAASSLYGSNAVGGVVNIISRTSSDPWTANVNAHIGAYQEQRYGATVSVNAGKTHNVLSVQHTYKDNVELDRDGDYSTIYGGRTWNVKDRLTVTPTERLTLTARAAYFFRERDYSPDEKNRYRDFSGGLRGEYTLGADDKLEAAYAFDQYDKSDYYPTTTRRDIRDYSNVQHTGRVTYTHTFGNAGTLVAGADVMRDYLMSYQFDGGEHTQYTAAAFAQLDWRVTERLELIGGLRYDYFSEARADRLSPKVAAMYRAGKVVLRASYAAGFRSPTLKEMYMDFDMEGIFNIYGNEELKAETSHNFQLSGEYTAGHYILSATAFHNIVDNRITTAWSQELDGMLYTNIREMDIAGIEATAAARYPCGLDARVTYCYTHEHVEKGEAYASATRPHTATLRLCYAKRWQSYGIDVSLTGRVLSDVDAKEYTSYTSYQSTETVHYPAYSIWKLSVTQRIGRAVRLTATIDNIFDYVPDYYYNNSPATTGATLAATLAVDIDRLLK